MTVAVVVALAGVGTVLDLTAVRLAKWPHRHLPGFRVQVATGVLRLLQLVGASTGFQGPWKGL